MQGVVQFDSDYPGEDDVHPYFPRYGVDPSPLSFILHVAGQYMSWLAASFFWQGTRFCAARSSKA